MIRLPTAGTALAPPERYGLEVIVDLARLLPVEDPAAPVTELLVVDEPRDPRSLAGLVADGWGISAGDGVVRVARAALRMIAEVAGAGVEQRVTTRDRHGRVPSSENPVAAAGLEREPVVSRAAIRLREAVIASAGRRPVRLLPAWPGGRRWAAAITHDLDAVEWWPLFTGLRVLELGRKGELRLTARALGAAVRSIGADPLGDGVRSLLAEEARRRLVSTWFVLCGTPTLGTLLAGDLTYRPEAKRAVAAVQAILAGGHEIGLHGSFETGDHPDAMAAERRRLGALAGREIAGVRQHFVKMNPGVTHRAMVAAGFGYDATFGFPDRNGFRLGVADLVPGWDEERGCSTDLMEVPLVWMDRALSKYRGIEQPQVWIDDALELASAAREVDGLWVGLWHPNLTAPLGFPGAPEAFARLLDELRGLEPHWGRLQDLMAWRRARRSVRACSVDADGRVTAVLASAPPAPIRLEDAHGAPAEEAGVG
jgi:hypothetical protein